MSDTSKLKEYLEYNHRLPEDVLLGHLVVTTVPDGAYPRDELCQLLKDAGLHDKYVPKLSSPLDGFRKATHRREKYYTTSRGWPGILRVETITSPSKEQVWKSVARKEQDPNKPALRFSQVGTIRMWRSIRKVGPKGRYVDNSSARLLSVLDILPDLDEPERNTITEFMREIESDYAKYTTTLSGSSIRTILRNFFTDMNGVLIKPSLWFVPQSNSRQLELLQNVIDCLGDTRLELIPLVDLKDQRDNLVRALSSDTEEQLLKLATQISGLMKQKSIPPSRYAEYLKKFKEATDRMETYEQQLGLKAEVRQSLVDVVRGQLNNVNKRLMEEA